MKGAYLGNDCAISMNPERWKSDGKRRKAKKTYSAFFNSRTVSAQNKLLRGRGKIGQTSNGKIFVVNIGRIPDNLISLYERPERKIKKIISMKPLLTNQRDKQRDTHLSHHRQNPRLRIVVSVGAYTEINFPIRSVLTKRSGQSKERILGCFGNDIGIENGGIDRAHDLRRDGQKTILSDGV